MSFYNFDAVVVHCWKCNYTQIHPLVNGLQCVQISDPSISEQIHFQKTYPQFGSHKYHLLGHYVCEHCCGKVELDPKLNHEEEALLEPMRVIVDECRSILYEVENLVLGTYVEFLTSQAEGTIFSPKVREALANKLEHILQRGDIINILDKGKLKQFANMGFADKDEKDYLQMAFEDLDEQVKTTVKNLLSDYVEFSSNKNAELKNIKALFSKKIFYVIREVELSGNMNFNPYVSGETTTRELELPSNGRRLFQKSRVRLVDYTPPSPDKNIDFSLFQYACECLEIMKGLKEVFKVEIKQKAMLKNNLP